VPSAGEIERDRSDVAHAAPLLEVDGLRTHFFTRDGVVQAVDGVGFEVARGETVGIVGESGSGKSVTALSIMRLLPRANARIVDGRIMLEGRDLAALDEAGMRRIRGGDIAMVFQEPMTSLNPVLKIGFQLAEAIRAHRGTGRDEARRRALEMLRLVRIPEPERRIEQYPFELSGGMRQRVMIAMALSCDPKLLIADEATTALDVTIQAQILELIRELKERLGMAVIMITHDLGVVAETCDRVVVMYAGRKVEEAPVEELFRRPYHPYTAGLLGSVPKLDRAGTATRGRLVEIKGMVPKLTGELAGCPFAPRCPLADARCRVEEPPLRTMAPTHTAACWHAERAEVVAHG